MTRRRDFDGAPLSDVQAWMGHQDISTTMRYVHYVPHHDAAARLTAAFTAETGTELPISPRNSAQLTEPQTAL